MNEEINKIAKREFGNSDIIIGNIKNGKPHAVACTCKKKDMAKTFEKLKGVLKG